MRTQIRTSSLYATENRVSSREALTAPLPTAEKLQTIYRSPGPFTSVYLATLPLSRENRQLGDRWEEMRRNLESQGAPLVALDAIETSLSIDRPEDISGIALLAASDGTTVVDYGMEPPRFDLGMVDSLPYVAPMLEWQQRRVAHLVVTVDENGADVAIFSLDHCTRIDTLDGGPETLVEHIVATAQLERAELVVVSGEAEHVGTLTDLLAQQVPMNCRVVTNSSATNVEQLTEFVVRSLSDLTAEATVHRLQDQRFFIGFDAAVDGTVDTVAALIDGTADRILIHDDPNDQRRIFVGTEPNQLSMEPDSNWMQARLVDGITWSALVQRIPVFIIPSTGSNGPDENAAALTSDDRLTTINPD